MPAQHARAQITLAEQRRCSLRSAQAARLTAERDRLWGEAAATRRRSELLMVVAAAEVQGPDKARLQELFYVEAAERLLSRPAAGQVNATRCHERSHQCGVEFRVAASYCNSVLHSCSQQGQGARAGEQESQENAQEDQEGSK